MSYDYLSSFPLSSDVLPQKLRGLLEPVGLSPDQSIEVASMYEDDPYGSEAESLQLLFAIVPENEEMPIATLDESSDGVVAYSVPAGGSGCASQFSPSISGYDYIVASWGDSSFYTFNLAEKVWMTLGLSPRCVGNDQQQLIYDDLGLPEFGVVEGEVSSEYSYSLKRNVSWKMSNEYLRHYLWLRGSRAVRVFYYSKKMVDSPELRVVMNAETHVCLKPDEGEPWYKLDIREMEGRLLLQLWASVEAMGPELCPEQTADGILWPGYEEPMTASKAGALIAYHLDFVYLDDKFLKKYEQSAFYDTTPVAMYGSVYCSPSYRSQWSFTDCRRVGRNLIKVPIRELYKPKPDREILHAHEFAIASENLANFDFDEEHIVDKTQRFLEAILLLGNGLSRLGLIAEQEKSTIELTKFDHVEITNNGWMKYPILSKLAQVAPLEMSQQEFLTRCKIMHEILQYIPSGFLKKLLQKAGCPRSECKDLGSLKLLQGLLNIIDGLNTNEEEVDAFISAQAPEGWKATHTAMAPLFLNNDLRIADAHEMMEECLNTLQRLGFDTANVNSGYGKALDFVMDGVIDSIETIGRSFEILLRR